MSTLFYLHSDLMELCFILTMITLGCSAFALTTYLIKDKRKILIYILVFLVFLTLLAWGCLLYFDFNLINK